jgi:hypothetical protein
MLKYIIFMMFGADEKIIFLLGAVEDSIFGLFCVNVGAKAPA